MGITDGKITREEQDELHRIMDILESKGFITQRFRDGGYNIFPLPKGRGIYP